jgi:hypothetical protein
LVRIYNTVLCDLFVLIKLIVMALETLNKNTYLITNDASYKNFLLDQEEETIKILGWKYTDKIVMFMTLFYHDRDLAIYLDNKYDDFQVGPSVSTDVISLEVARYLYAMSDENLRESYYEFIDHKDIILDLMLLKRLERIELIADLLEWLSTDLIAIDFISAN